MRWPGEPRDDETAGMMAGGQTHRRHLCMGVRL